MRQLIDFVTNRTVRGACQCGKCIDAPENPQDHQPEDLTDPTNHTADLIFFKVAVVDSCIDIEHKEKFIKMVQLFFPQWLDEAEHSYLEIGGDVGDQGTALEIMGFGKILGVWDLLTPESILPEGIPEEIKKQLAQRGMITIVRRTGGDV